MRKIGKRHSLMLAFILLSGSMLFGQVKFNEISSRQEMEEAMALSDSLNLPIYIDVYATWCGPCKMMDRQTFTDKAVGDLLNKEFIALKLDGETDYGTYFSYQYQLEGYPSSFIFAPGGDLITRLIGFQGPEELLGKLRSVRENFDLLSKFEKKYQEDKLEANEIMEYIAALVALGRDEEAESVAVKYISAIEPDKALTATDIRIISNYVNPGTPVWDRLLAEQELTRQALDTLYGDFVSSAFYRSVLSAIQENNIDYVRKFTSCLPELTEGTEIDGPMLSDLAYIQFYYYTTELDSLFNFVDSQFEGKRKDDSDWLFNVASRIVDIDQQFANPDILDKALSWFNLCLGISEKFEYHFYAGMCSYMLGDTEKSIKSFDRAKVLASDDNEKELIESVFKAIQNE